MRPEKPWSGRFNAKTNPSVETFTASLDVDCKLYRYDIMGSIAHCRMLAKQNIIPKKDASAITKALREIERELDSGKLACSPAFEDIHMRIEARLIEKLGPVGGKLHTARSRNDQIALDESLYLRDAAVRTVARIADFQGVLISCAETNLKTILPGYTHLQHAQPLLLAHHVLAYFEMMQRDKERMQACYQRANRMPLGAGALAGTPHPIDRDYVAKLLGYPAVTANSIDTVSDRDTLIEYCSNAAMILMHLSRFSEELILWSSQEFQFVSLPQAFCTGSSIMPQKQNPDVLELIRGKTGRVYGNLVSLLTIMKALPLAYNRDLQEDKVPLFDTVETTQDCLGMFSALLKGIRFNEERMAAATREGFITATDLADYLTSRGLPFRSAHDVTGRIVRYCEKKNRQLWELTTDELRSFSPAIGTDVAGCLSVSASADCRNSAGGTGTRSVKKALTRAKAQLRKDSRFIQKAVTSAYTTNTTGAQ